MKRIAFMFLAFGLAVAVAAPPATPEQIDQAIRELGSEDYQTRERASNFLWAAGQPAEAALRKALDSNDAEVVSRARELLDKIPYGIMPDSPKKIVDLITRARAASLDSWPNIVTEIFDDPDGLETARMIADKQSDANRRLAFRRGIDKVGWKLAARLIANDRLDLAEEMLGRSAATQSAVQPPDIVVLRNFAAMARLRGTLAKERAVWEKWIDGPLGTDGFVDEKTPGGSAARMVSFYLAKAANDSQRAVALSQTLPANPWLESAYFDARRWADLASVLSTAVRPTSAIEPLHRASFRMVLFRLAGNEGEAAKAREEFTKAFEARRDGQAEWWGYIALICDRRPMDALKFAESTSYFRLQLVRSQMLMQQGRPADALAVLKNTSSQQPGDQLRLAAAIAGIYVTTGDRNALDAHLATLSKGPYRSSPEQVAAGEVVAKFVALGLHDAAREQASALIQGGVSPIEVMSKLFPKTPLAAEAWFAHFTRSPGLTTPVEILKVIPPLVDQRLSGQAEQTRLDQALTWTETRPQSERGRLFRGFAEAAHAAGLTERAITIAKRAAELQPTETNLLLGDLYAKSGQWNEAAAAYEKAMGPDSQPLPRFLAGVARQKAGDAQKGAALQLTAQLLLLGSDKQPQNRTRDETTRSLFCDQLERRKELAPEISQTAREQRRLLVDLSLPGSFYGRSSLAVLCQDKQAFPDHQEAASANEFLLLRILLSRSLNDDPVVTLYRLHSSQARSLLSKGDVAGAMAAANDAFTTLPTSIEFASEFVPELTKGGHTVEADAFYAKVASVFDRLTKEFPNSEAYRTQRANLASRCGRQS